MNVEVKRPFQKRVIDWMMNCFSNEVCRDRIERNHRFLEEALELVQALGCTKSESHQLVDYVFDRPAGQVEQELGGVMVTIAALCGANDLDMATAGEAELDRIWTKIEVIRSKQAAKPKHSPLPGPAATADPHAEIERLRREKAQLVEAAVKLLNPEFQDGVEEEINRQHQGDCTIIEAVTIAFELSGMSAAIRKITASDTEQG